MLKQCSNKDVQSVLRFIGDNWVSCPYLCLDLEAFGINKPDYNLWVSLNNGRIVSVFYKYVDCLHVFFDGDFNSEDLLILKQKINPKTIVMPFAKQKIIRSLFDAKNYSVEYNHLGTIKKILPENPNVKVTLASSDDVDEVARLTLLSPIFSSVYSFDVLSKSLRDRLLSNTGRIFIIKNDSGKIIASISTNIETNRFAILGGLIVDPSERGKGLASAISAVAWNTMNREGRMPLSNLLFDNKATISLHKKLGYVFLNKSIKIVRNGA